LEKDQRFTIINMHLVFNFDLHQTKEYNAFSRRATFCGSSNQTHCWHKVRQKPVQHGSSYFFYKFLYMPPANTGAQKAWKQNSSLPCKYIMKGHISWKVTYTWRRSFSCAICMSGYRICNCSVIEDSALLQINGNIVGF